MSSWRWLLVLEGIPALVCGLLTYFLLPSRPEEARFLTADEKQRIRAELAREEKGKLKEHQYSAMQTLASGRVWCLVSIYFGMLIGLYTLNSWAAQLVKSLSTRYSNSVVGLLVMIPNLVGLAGMVLVSRHSDRTLKRRYHVAVLALAGGSAVISLRATHSAFFSVALLSLLAVGVYGFLGPFWALPSEFLTGFSAAAGLALVNSVGNLAGFVGPYMVGFLSQRTGGLYGSMPFTGVFLFASAILVLLLPKAARLPGA